MNNVLVLGGGAWQIPIINFLKEKGHTVYVVDPFPTSEAVRKGIPHHIICEDIRNVSGILEKIKDIPFEFIISDQSDIAMDPVTLLSEKLDLPCNSIEAVQRFTNKFISRGYAESIGFSIPSFTKVSSAAQIKEFITNKGLPIILKPADSQSSRGIVKIDENNQHNIAELFAGSMEASKLGYVICEEFVEGTEITIEGICSGGKHRTLALSSKKHFRTGIASELYYPAQLEEQLLAAVEKENDRYVEQSGLDFGITHAEYIVNPARNKFWLIEIACRGGGTLISSDIAPWVSGVNLYDILYRSLCGEKVNVKNLQPSKKNAILQFFEFPAGKVKNIQGEQAAHKLKGVIALQLMFQLGDELKAATDDRSRQAFVVILAENKTELENTLRTVKECIKIEYEVQ